MPNGKPDELPEPVPDFVPDPVKGFGQGTPGPSLHVYDTRPKAEKAAEHIPGETRVRRRKIDGRQRHVVERKTGNGRADGVSIETWVEAPYEVD